MLTNTRANADVLPPTRMALNLLDLAQEVTP